MHEHEIRDIPADRFVGGGAQAANCILDTSTPAKTKAALTCLQNRLAALEALKKLGSPVILYEDQFTRFDLIGKSRIPTTFPGPSIRMSVRITNKTASLLRLATDHQNAGGRPLVTDDSAVSIRAGYSGIANAYSASQPGSYSPISPSKSITISLQADSVASAVFTGKYFDVSFQLLRYNPATFQGEPFSVSFTDIPIP